MTASALSYDPGFVVLLPTGTMTFYSNGTQLGTPVTIEAGEVPPTIQFSTTQLPAGLNNISVQYSGDTNYAGSTSPMTSVDVGGTFSITANPNTIDIASPGQSGSTTLTFAAQNGFTGSTPLSSSTCSNLPPKSSCSFSPSTVTFTSSATTVPVTLTITTTGLITTFARVSTPGYEGLRIGELAGLFLVGICIVPFNVRRQIRYWNRMIAFIGLSLMLFLTSCGGGGATVATGGGGGGGTIPGTPAGNYQGITVMVNINGVMQLINNLTVNVQ